MNPVYRELRTFPKAFTAVWSTRPQSERPRIYYYDTASSTMEVANLLQNEPELFGTYDQFLDDCNKGNLPDYSFVEPNYSDHDTGSGEEVANDQHPDHNVQAGELFIASVYNAIKTNAQLWQSIGAADRL